MSTSRLLLIDGSNLFYRAFFAIAELSTRDGRPTNAVYGFIRMMRQLEREWRPTHWGVIMDGGRSAERTTLLPEYKAHRPPMPEKLKEQFTVWEEYLTRAGIHFEKRSGEEADDLMASLVRMGGAMSEILLVTSDKDFFQLATDRVGIVSPAKINVRLGPAEIVGKLGVAPEAVVDFLALTGDAVDNIPGVPGVGPKTAALWLGHWGNWEGILQHLEELKPVWREKLTSCRNRVEVNRNLIRLYGDRMAEVDWERFRVQPESADQMLPFYESLEFESLARPLRERQLF
jgi:DNA polymerase-1